MAESHKLELLLTAKDRLSPAIQRLLKLLKSLEKDGKTSTNVVDKLAKKFERAPKTGGLKKANAEIEKTAKTANKAAAAEEKLNNVRKRGNAGNGNSKKEITDKITLAGATNKAAVAEEKLNNARRRGGAANRRPPTYGGGSFQEDLVQGGAGATGLWLAKKGAGAAMSQQEAFTDVHNSFYRSSLSAGEMNGQMEKAEEISIRLGNKLKGNTADFANMLSVMKQNGMEATTILEGAGEAAAYLAIANREDYSDVGKNYAQFGQLFEVKGKEDNLKIADLISRAKGKGISSEDLITASKFFGGRTAKTLGLTGAKGAEETLRFMTFIKQHTALDASSVGTGSSAFFRAFSKDEGKKNPIIPEMEKKLGIKLDLFDDKGKFKGLENAVAKFAQLKGKLSDKESLQFGQDLAGDEGAAVLGAMISAGDAYRKENKDLDQMASMMTKVAKESENLANKIEGLTGSLENLGAESFKPMLTPLGKLTDKTNEWVGSLTEAAKSKPVFAATTAGVVTLGSALLTLKAGSGFLSRLADRFGNVGGTISATTTKASGLNKVLGGLSSFKGMAITAAAAEGISLYVQMWSEAAEKSRQVAENAKTISQEHDALLSLGLLYNAPGDYKGQKGRFDAQAGKIFDTMKRGGDLEKALHPEKATWWETFTNPTPYGMMPTQSQYGGAQFSPDVAAKMWREAGLANEIADPNILARVISKIQGGGDDGARLNMSDVGLVMQAVEKIAGKDKMATALDVLNKEKGIQTVPKTASPLLQQNIPFFKLPTKQETAEPAKQFFGQLQQPTNSLTQDFFSLGGKVSPLGDTFSGLNTSAGNSSGSIIRLGGAADSVAFRLSSLQITPPSFGTINFPFGQSYNPPKPKPLFGSNPNFVRLFGSNREKGGSVKKGHEYRINEVGQEFFTPAQSGSIVSNDILRKREQTARLLQKTKSGGKDNKQGFAFSKTENIYNSSYLFPKTKSDRNDEKNVSLTAFYKNNSVVNNGLPDTSPLSRIFQSLKTENQSSIPALNTRVSTARNDVLRGKHESNSTVIHFNPTINLYSNNPNDAKEAIEVLERELAKMQRELAGVRSEVREEVSPRRMAQKVAYEAERDSERI